MDDIWAAQTLRTFTSAQSRSFVSARMNARKLIVGRRAIRHSGYNAKWAIRHGGKLSRHGITGMWTLYSVQKEPGVKAFW